MKLENLISVRPVLRDRITMIIVTGRKFAPGSLRWEFVLGVLPGLPGGGGGRGGVCICGSQGSI